MSRRRWKLFASNRGPFDIIFNDIDKEAYPASLPGDQGKIRSGGLLIIDNMLWSGRIFDDKDLSPATEGVREFTRRSPLTTIGSFRLRQCAMG